MEPTAKGKGLVAVDLGAQSCRVSLLRWSRGEPSVQLVHRFPNAPRRTPNGLRWSTEQIFNGIAHGLRLAAAASPEGIVSIAIDGWAVDYVRLRRSGKPVEEPYCYRDVRTEEAATRVHKILPPQRLYGLTGIQILRLNTIYQLYADKLAKQLPEIPWVNLPEYMSYRLGGKRVAEYTNATHTGLVALGTHAWCEEIFLEAGLDIAAAPPIVATGSDVGTLQGELSQVPELRGARILVPACHDTAAAVAAIPATGSDWAFLSSGTWSLIGTVLDAPCVSERARDSNFTNLGGVGGLFYFLKNVNGMWLLQQCIEEWEKTGGHVDLAELVASCRSLGAPHAEIDIDEPGLMMPGGTIAKINEELRQRGRGQLSPHKSEAPVIANLIFHSMAARYAEVLASLSEIIGRKFSRLFVVGGGSQNAFLNKLTAERSGIEIVQGSSESATVGNFAVQLAALDDARDTEGVPASSVRRWSARLLAQSRTPAFVER